MAGIQAVTRPPELERRLDALGALLSARPQLGPEPGYRARLLRQLDGRHLPVRPSAAGAEPAPRAATGKTF